MDQTVSVPYGSAIQLAYPMVSLSHICKKTDGLYHMETKNYMELYDFRNRNLALRKNGSYDLCGLIGDSSWIARHKVCSYLEIFCGNKECSIKNTLSVVLSDRTLASWIKTLQFAL